ncbi:MAG: hypothetical protein E6Q97_04395 [Desulfurellales bacterium]|nr:MAG: hypothetical protein E6Q97_04395 [Desulfurellales bacterium]
MQDIVALQRVTFVGDVYKSTGRRKGKVWKSRRWYGSWINEDGKRVNRALSAHKPTARRLLAKLENEALQIRNGLLPRAAKHGDTPLADHRAAWLETLSDRQQANLAHRVEVLCDGWTKLADIDARAAEKRAAALQVSTRTRYKYLQALRQFVRWCLKHSRIAYDPLLSLKLPGVAATPRRALSVAEQQKLLTTESPPFRDLDAADRRALYAAALGSGLRASELARLTREDYDGEALRVEGAPGRKQKRTIRQPLPKWVSDTLDPWVAGRRGVLWPGSWHERAAEMVVHDGVEAKFHELRHTYISALIAAGLTPKEVQVLARHSTITLTFDVYGHADAGKLSCAIRALASPH